MLALVGDHERVHEPGIVCFRGRPQTANTALAFKDCHPEGAWGDIVQEGFCCDEARGPGAWSEEAEDVSMNMSMSVDAILLGSCKGGGERWPYR